MKKVLIIAMVLFTSAVANAKSSITLEPHNEGKGGWLLRKLVDVDFGEGIIGSVRHNVDGEGKLTAIIGYKAKVGKFILNSYAGASFIDNLNLVDLRMDFVGVVIHKRFCAVLVNTLGIAISDESTHSNYTAIAAGMRVGRFNLGVKIDHFALLSPAKSIFMKIGPRLSFSPTKNISLGLWSGWLTKKDYDHMFVRFEMKWTF